MSKYIIELQDEEKACGAFCILMILKHYGFKEEVKEIKAKARMNQNGISIKGMLECLKEYQIEATTYEASLDDIEENVKLPCILYMIYGDLGHYVVLYEIKDDEYIIGDPAKGLVTLYRDALEENYTKRMIAITHVGRVPELNYKPYTTFLKETFIAYKKNMMSLIFKGIYISLLGYISSYFFQVLIDRITITTPFFYMVVLSLAYCLVEIIKTKIEKTKTDEMINLQRAIDEDDVFVSSMNILKQPYSFFYQDKGALQSQLLSLFDLSEMSIACFERLFVDGSSFIIFMIGMLVLNYKMALCVIIMSILITLLTYKRLTTLQEMNRQYLEAGYVYQHHILELIENQFLIKRFLILQKQRERSYHLYLDEALLKQQQALFVNKMQTTIQYIIYFFYGIILILGFYFYQNKHLSIGQLLMFYMLVSYCIQPLMNMVALAAQYKQVSIIYEKYKAFEVEETNDKEDIQEKITSITFDNVGYAYGYQLPILEHIDFTISRHLLLKGITGSGKSTLLRLLMGVDLNYTGDIYLNNQELRTINLNSLYQHIGYTNETPTFLHMSVYDNFLCDDEDLIKKYLKAFGQEDLCDMFHCILSEDGSPLSLGQRQIVALVRLLCQDYDVYILDEAFSHMDTRLAGKVMRYLLKNFDDKIFIMVNHQTKVMNKNLDCVIIEDGKIKSKG
ncbi:MAG: cysteine peptidase family C39 domain-containing protein [Erysipelotrichaceae bacterium]|nr:cysteine peptidase family C39 domain-containing protein [Erysipelotrichaceae bacterium]